MLENAPANCLCEPEVLFETGDFIRSMVLTKRAHSVEALTIATSFEVSEYRVYQNQPYVPTPDGPPFRNVVDLVATDLDGDSDVDVVGLDAQTGIIHAAHSQATVTNGVLYCNSSSVNSTGRTAYLEVNSSPSFVEGATALRAWDLPRDVPVLFLTSRYSGHVPGAGGSAGTLCLGGGIGRFDAPGQIQNSGADGFVRLDVEHCGLPTPAGTVCYEPGEVWFFQGWYRDPTNGNSNFTTAVASQ